VRDNTKLARLRAKNELGGARAQNSEINPISVAREMKMDSRVSETNRSTTHEHQEITINPPAYENKLRRNTAICEKQPISRGRELKWPVCGGLHGKAKRNET
jgi:hypothetical protein